MKKVIVASENPVKVEVARRAFSSVYPDDLFDFLAVKSDPGVSDQPTNEETKRGARNRLEFVKNKYPNADFWISQEGGLFSDGSGDDERLYNRAWIMVCDREGCIAESSTAHFSIPRKMAEYIKGGMDLGHASDVFFKSTNSKHGSGAIGHITGGIIDRTDFYLPAAVIALSELKHRDWYR